MRGDPTSTTNRALRPVLQFLQLEAASALLLLAATIGALVWANSPWSGGYERLWTTELPLDFLAPPGHVLDLRHVVNDALMTLFFLVVGMEVKRELVVGELREPRAAALPALAALGGMVVPAAIYVLVTAGGAGGRGWGVPMATDIAFAIGVVTVLGSRVPAAAKTFLLALATVDDIGAIVVIAVFYSESVAIAWLAVAATMLGVVVLLQRHGTRPLLLVTLGAVVWWATYRSGVHATIAGVALGLSIPARARRRAGAALDPSSAVTDDDTGADLEPSPCDRVTAALHPWTSFVIIPFFALANAGVDISGESLRSPSAVLVGVFAGLVVGKLVGITAFAWLAVRLGVARLPDAVRWIHITGLAAVAGIGFTVALFVAGLAFDAEHLADAKLGIVGASLVASLVGVALLARAPRAAPPLPSAAPDARGTHL